MTITDPDGRKWHIHVRREIHLGWGDKVYRSTRVGIHTDACIYAPARPLTLPDKVCVNGVVGYTQCTPGDQFIKAEGIKIAFARAVRGFDRQTRSFLWRELYKRYKHPGQQHLASKGQ